MNRINYLSDKGMLIYKMDETHVCTLVETEPGCWEIVCKGGKKRLGSFARAKKLADDFVNMIRTHCLSQPGNRLPEQEFNKEFREFLEYRLG